MNELLIKLGIGTLGAICGIFLFRILGNKRASSEQETLQAATRIIDKEVNLLDKANKEKQKDGENKIKVIEDEQKKEVTESNIIDFFSNRKP